MNARKILKAYLMLVVVFFVCFCESYFFRISKSFLDYFQVFFDAVISFSLLFGRLKCYAFIVSEVMRSTAWPLFYNCGLFPGVKHRYCSLVVQWQPAVQVVVASGSHLLLLWGGDCRNTTGEEEEGIST